MYYRERRLKSDAVLSRHLLGNPGSLFSVEKFCVRLKSQGLAISRDTLHDLVRHVEDCFLVRTTWLEATSERKANAPG